MKKVTKSLFLAVTVLALTSCIGNFQQGGSMTKTGSIVDRDTAHAIEVLKDEQVTVDAPSSAKAGDKVEFIVDYDEESYVLERVTVNDELPAYVEGEGFYFVMPEEDVTITIAGHVIEHEEEKREYQDRYLNYAKEFNQDCCMKKMRDMLVETIENYEK